MQDFDIHFTIGPACWPEPVLDAVIRTGITSCRINLSHTKPDELPRWFAHLRSAMKRTGKEFRIGADIRGRKLRIGSLPGGQVDLEPGQEFSFIPTAAEAEQPGTATSASVNCPVLSEVVKPGDPVLLDDGTYRLRISSVDRSGVHCRVETGGELSERCGFYLPKSIIRLPALTPRDEADLDALAELRPDFVYLSFVQTASDILELRKALQRRKLEVPIVAKVERSLAITNIAEIVQASDGICLARGDLGVEIPLPELPATQRRVIAECTKHGKPGLLAGEVLFSLIEREVPFRAETTDVDAAVEQGFGGFILSDETAIGCNPPNAVRWLRALAHLE